MEKLHLVQTYIIHGAGSLMIFSICISKWHTVLIFVSDLVIAAPRIKTYPFMSIV